MLNPQLVPLLPPFSLEDEKKEKEETKEEKQKEANDEDEDEGDWYGKGPVLALGWAGACIN